MKIKISTIVILKKKTKKILSLLFVFLSICCSRENPFSDINDNFIDNFERSISSKWVEVGTGSSMQICHSSPPDNLTSSLCISESGSMQFLSFPLDRANPTYDDPLKISVDFYDNMNVVANEVTFIVLRDFVGRYIGIGIIRDIAPAIDGYYVINQIGNTIYAINKTRQKKWYTITIEKKDEMLIIFFDDEEIRLENVSLKYYEFAIGSGWTGNINIISTDNIPARETYFDNVKIIY